VPTLELAIDARRARYGADDFASATDRVKASATGAAGATEKFTVAIEGHSRAQHALQRALDVSGNLAKGFLTSLAIAPVLALGSALSTAALKMLGFGENTKAATEAGSAFAKQADAITESLKRLNTEAALAGKYPGLFSSAPGAVGSSRQAQIQDLLRSMTSAGGAYTTPEQREAMGALGIHVPNVGDSRTPDMAAALAALGRAAQEQQAFSGFNAALNAPGGATALPGFAGTGAPGFAGSPSRAAALARASAYATNISPVYGGGYSPGGMSQFTGYGDTIPGLVGLQGANDPLAVFLGQNRAPGYVPGAGGFNSITGLQGPDASEFLKQQEATQRSAENIGDAFANSSLQALEAAQSLGDGLAMIFRSVLQQILAETAGKALASAGTSAAVSVLGGSTGVPAGGGSHVEAFYGSFGRSSRQLADDQRRAIRRR
jgi:hypothetical protein